MDSSSMQLMDGTCSALVAAVSRKKVSVGLFHPLLYLQLCSSVPDSPGIWCEVAEMSGQAILIIGKNKPKPCPPPLFTLFTLFSSFLDAGSPPSACSRITLHI